MLSKTTPRHPARPRQARRLGTHVPRLLLPNRLLPAPLLPNTQSCAPALQLYIFGFRGFFSAFSNILELCALLQVSSALLSEVTTDTSHAWEEMEKELLKGHLEGTQPPKVLPGTQLGKPSTLSRPAGAEHCQKHAAFKQQHSKIAPWVWGIQVSVAGYQHCHCTYSQWGGMG